MLPSPAADAAAAELRAYHAKHNLWEYVPAYVARALGALRDTGVQLVVVSNANGVLHHLFDRLSLSSHFDVICDSCVEGVEKPDPRFFRIALDRCGGRPETTMHVGALYYVDVVGARRAGIDAVLIDPHDGYAGYDVRRIGTLQQLVGLIG